MLALIVVFLQLAQAQPMRSPQAWSRQSECVRWLGRVVPRLDRELPRWTGRWTVESRADEVSLVLSVPDDGLGRHLELTVAAVALPYSFDPAARPHPRGPTPPWDNAPVRPPLTKINRRAGPDDQAWVEYNELSTNEGKKLEALVEPILDRCLAALDPMVSPTSWEPIPPFDGRFEVGF